MVKSESLRPDSVIQTAARPISRSGAIFQILPRGFIFHVLPLGLGNTDPCLRLKKGAF